MPTRRFISAADLAGLPGLRRAARDALIARPPATVAEALTVPDVARKTTKYLLESGLISDPEGMQEGTVLNRAPRSRSSPGGLRR